MIKFDDGEMMKMKFNVGEMMKMKSDEGEMGQYNFLVFVDVYG